MSTYLDPSKTKRLVKVQVRTAQKEHTCQYCSDPIRPGEKYTRLLVVVEDGSPDGSVETVKFHTPE